MGKLANKYAVFNTGFIKSSEFSDAISEAGESQSIVKNALVAVEGSFKDSEGTEHTFPSERLSSIAQTTNKYLSGGGVLPVCLDHKKDVLNTVGSVLGEAYTKIITQDDLPNPRATNLLGKLGLFFSDVVIKAQDAVTKVRDGIVTSVSMGLNLEPTDHRIVELSLVPIPAIPNMGLFKYAYSNYAYPSVEYKTDAFTWEDLEANEQTLDDLKEEYNDLTENLWIILNNIYNSSAIDITDITVLQQYVYSALNGFSERVVDTLGLSNIPNESTGMTEDPASLSAEQQAQMQSTQYQDLASASNTGVQYKYSRGKVVNFKASVITNKYLKR